MKRSVAARLKAIYPLLQLLRAVNAANFLIEHEADDNARLTLEMLRDLCQTQLEAQVQNLPLQVAMDLAATLHALIDAALRSGLN